MFVLRKASRGSVHLVLCLWLCAAVFLCTLLKSESSASWSFGQAFRSSSILQPSRRLSRLPRRCDPPADPLKSTLLGAEAGETAPEGDVPEGSVAEPAADAAGDATVRKGVQDFKVGEIIDGKVRNKGKGTVWVDIGIPKGAWLDGERKDKFKLEYGEALTGLHVDEVDVEKGWITVSLPDLESRVKDRVSKPRTNNTSRQTSPTNQAQSATAAGSSPKADSKTASIRVGGNKAVTKLGLGRANTLEVMIAGVSVSKMDVDYESGRIVIGLGAGEPAAKAEKPAAPAEKPSAKAKATPPPRQKPKPTAEELAELEDLEVGATLKGKVATKNRDGVWVNIGKTRDAKVKVLPKIGEKLEWGEELDVTVASIDKEVARVIVTISEQEQAKIFAREVSRKSLESIEVGASVSGYITVANRFGIFVDIGAEKDALLLRQQNITRSLRNGDHVENMQVTDVNLTARTMTLSLPQGSKGSGDDDEF